MYPNEFNEVLFKGKYRIKSTRLPNWDYSSDGFYFVTICTKNRIEWFGEIPVRTASSWPGGRNGIMGLSDIGCIAYEQWKLTGELRDNVILDEFIVMPNHVHGIIQIFNHFVETHCNASLRNDDNWNNNQFGPQRNNLASIVRGFKSSVKRICNKNNIPFEWQPRFYDHIIRNEKDLYRIRRYIKYNPRKWELDRNNPEGLWM